MARLHDINGRVSMLEQQNRSTMDAIYAVKDKVTKSNTKRLKSIFQDLSKLNIIQRKRD